MGSWRDEEGLEEEVELAGVGEALDAGVAEADGLALGLGDEGDVGFGERETPTQEPWTVVPSLARAWTWTKMRSSWKETLGVVGVDEAGGGGGAADVVTGVGGVEELGAEGAFEGLGGDADLGGVGGNSGEER